MPKNINLKLEDDNINYLNDLNKKTNIPITKIVNILISEMDKETLELLEYEHDESDSEIRFKITPNERNFLLEESKKSGAGNITTEIKYRLLNSIYKNKYFTSNELKEFVKSRYELNMIGRNLNQILKQLHTREELKDYSQDLKTDVNNINEKIKNMQKELELIIKFTNKRF